MNELELEFVMPLEEKIFLRKCKDTELENKQAPAQNFGIFFSAKLIHIDGLMANLICYCRYNKKKCNVLLLFFVIYLHFFCVLYSGFMYLTLLWITLSLCSV